MFESVVARCIKQGVVGGEIFATNSSVIRSDANKQNSKPTEEWNISSLDPSKVRLAVMEYLEVLDDAAFGAAS